MPSVSIDDLSPDARKRALHAAGRTKRPAVKRFTAEHERRYALRVLALISDLSQAERSRVLKRAQKANEI